MHKYLAEFLGTFALLFCGTGAVIVNHQSGGALTHVGIAVTFGLVVMVMIYALGDVSGAHMNPAVTLAFALAGRFPTRQITAYAASQVAGGTGASLALKALFPANETLGITVPAGTDMQAFAMEFLLTFFLMLVIINVATGSKEQGMFAGLAIGSTVSLEAMFAGPVSGASMNPVRSLAPALVSGHTEHLWLYLTAPVLGAATAVPVWKFLHRKTASQ